MAYFKEFPIIRYPSFLTGKNSSLDYVEVANLFRRVKLREDIQKEITLFDKYEINNTIDYLSIDTEGTELEILNSLDFKKYDIKIISVEHNFTSNREAIYNLLTINNYERVQEKYSKFDDWYVKIKN